MTIQQLEKRLRRAEKNICATKKYKVYTALLTQSGVNAPTVTVLENTLGGTPVWTYNALGIYEATLSGAFIVGQTTVSLGGADSASSNAFNWTTDVGSKPNSIYLTFSDVTTNLPTNGLLNETLIEIRVYKCEGVTTNYDTTTTTTSTTTTTTIGG